MTLDELKAEDKRLLDIYQKFKDQTDAAARNWVTVHHKVETIEAREKLRAELLAEMEAEKQSK